MIRSLSALVLLCCATAPAVAADSTEPANVKHYRFTFLITDQSGPAQSYALDVPVTPEHAGAATMTQDAGLSDLEASRVARSLACRDVRATSSGIAAKVTFAQDSATPSSSQTKEPIHHQLNFERQVDVMLGKPTRITGEMQPRPLKPGDTLRAPLPPPAPMITLTVDAL